MQYGQNNFSRPNSIMINNVPLGDIHSLNKTVKDIGKPYNIQKSYPAFNNNDKFKEQFPLVFYVVLKDDASEAMVTEFQKKLVSALSSQYYVDRPKAVSPHHQYPWPVVMELCGWYDIHTSGMLEISKEILAKYEAPGSLIRFKHVGTDYGETVTHVTFFTHCLGLAKQMVIDMEEGSDDFKSSCPVLYDLGYNAQLVRYSALCDEILFHWGSDIMQQEEAITISQISYWVEDQSVQSRQMRYVEGWKFDQNGKYANFSDMYTHFKSTVFKMLWEECGSLLENNEGVLKLPYSNNKNERTLSKVEVVLASGPTNSAWDKRLAAVQTMRTTQELVPAAAVVQTMSTTQEYDALLVLVANQAETLRTSEEHKWSLMQDMTKIHDVALKEAHEMIATLEAQAVVAAKAADKAEEVIVTLRAEAVVAAATLVKTNAAAETAAEAAAEAADKAEAKAKAKAAVEPMLDMALMENNAIKQLYSTYQGTEFQPDHTYMSPAATDMHIEHSDLVSETGCGCEPYKPESLWQRISNLEMMVFGYYVSDITQFGRVEQLETVVFGVADTCDFFALHPRISALETSLFE